MRAPKSMQHLGKTAEPLSSQESLRDSVRQILAALNEVLATERAEVTAREVGLVLLGASQDLAAGSIFAHRTGRILDVPVGGELVGRVVDALGRPLDERGPIRLSDRRPVERPAPPILHRAPVTKPLQTGLEVIDPLLPIGRGQRELILGDRQTGKTAIALDTILNQSDQGVLCVYLRNRAEEFGRGQLPLVAAASRRPALLRRRRGLGRASRRGSSTSLLSRRPPWPSTSWSRAGMS